MALLYSAAVRLPRFRLAAGQLPCGSQLVRLRAARLFTDAERIAHTLTDEPLKADALSGIAGALAATDPDRAETITRTITGEYRKAEVLSRIAKALAATHPDRAETIAHTITDKYWKADTLSGIAKTLAAAFS